nr:hypothetical protein [uncultured Methanolobus sp.]
MITICEPHVKGISHEKVNSGFIYGLRLAYPEEKIRFYADITHIIAIKDILDIDKINIENIEYVPIKFHDLYSIKGMFTYYFLFNRIFTEVQEAGTNKIFFLSMNPTTLYIIKKLKFKKKYKEMKFTLVLHGRFDNIAYDDATGIDLPLKSIKNKHRVQLDYTVQMLKQMKLIAASKILISNVLNRFIMPWHLISEKVFTDKKILLWEHSTDYKYIALSPHIIKNAEKYLNVKELNMYAVILPTIFKKPNNYPTNEYPKFAIFGYGNPLMLHNILIQLSQKNIKNTYEIRIIGMDNRGTSQFPNVTCPSPGKRLDRNEMEKYAEDIDMFLILYDKTRYRLSCSGSILESLSYTKPILHFDNDCINFFNKSENPIGIRCNTLEDFVNKMEDIIENYESYRPEFQKFRNNILKLRNECSIESSVITLKESFTW